jgi:hypothetical protein
LGCARWQRDCAYLEGAEQALVNTHHSTCIVKFTAVVGCTKQGDKLSLREEFVSIFYDLMGSTDKIHVMLLEEARYDVWTECEGDASVVFAPARDILVRVGPEEIAEETTVGNLCVSVLERDSHLLRS